MRYLVVLGALLVCLASAASQQQQPPPPPPEPIPQPQYTYPYPARSETQARRSARVFMDSPSEVTRPVQPESDTYRTREAAAATRGGYGSSTPGYAPTTSGKLLVFGGRDHKKFLGCVCGEYDADSILNTYGSFGNRYSTDTIWNKYGDYGSPYSNTSVCNEYASNPPVVVTDAGVFVGYLTLNRSKTGAITEPDVLTFLEKTVCEK